MSQRVSEEGDSGEWYFFDGGPGAPRYGDDPTKHAVDHDTESFVREVLQNANDQRVASDRPVEVTFRFETLGGADRDRFLEALQWEEGLAERIEAIAEPGRGSGYRQFLERAEDPEAELRLLVVEDRNTTGLTGEWDEDSNYAALVRDELYSRKQEDTAGGSYGLGKSVLWTFSSASTVLFNSHPIASGEPAAGGPRLIGRTKLPTHEREGSTYQGAGWLCDVGETADGIRPESLWGPEAAGLAERLHVDRPQKTGTSAMVVGFQDPTRDRRLSIEELADGFVESSVKYFWPAMIRGDLEVTVVTPDRAVEANVDDVSALRPFVQCYRERHTDAEHLDTPGDVAGVDVPVELPPREDGTEVPGGSVRLAARFASPVDTDTYLNKVALFRGSGMVVKYLDQSRIAYADRTFFGTLACGLARGEETTETDEEIERFLRFAEPPEHDEWESTENLRNEYAWGFRTALEDILDTARDGLRHVVAGSRGGDRRVSSRVTQRFPIHGGVSTRPTRPPSAPVFDIESRSYFEAVRWRFEGAVSPLREFEGWSAEVSLTGIGEDGSAGSDVPIASVDCEADGVTVEIEDGRALLQGTADAEEVGFSGASAPVTSGEVLRGDVGETRLEIRAELAPAEEP